MQSVSAVRNKDGIWINSEVFREEAIHFKKYGYYTPDAEGSPAWVEYWEEQEKRRIMGYEVGGVRITGHHYHYLNFCQIDLTDTSQVNRRTRAVKKQASFPTFWDGDYNYFWALEIARNGILDVGLISEEEADRIYNLPDLEKAEQMKRLYDSLGLMCTITPDFMTGGFNLIVGKARRKGYSFKNAAICENIYDSQPGSLTVIGAFDKKYLYPKGTMGMASRYINFINKHTGFAKAKEYVDKQEHRRASYKEIVNGIAIESGYMSEIQAITFKDNPDAARGKDAALILFEEAGKFPNLIDSFRATQDSMSDGIYQSGQMVIFGTGGDMERDTLDFSKMFYHPTEYNCLPFVNIWDDNATNSFCSFFHPDAWNLVGFTDAQGNSDIAAATEYDNQFRENLKKNSTSSASLQQRVQEHPQKPSEAFLTISINDFPVVELQNRLNLVTRENLHIKHGVVGRMYRDSDGKPRFKPDMDGDLEPLWDYEPKTSDHRGAIVIYEAPIAGCKAYKGGYDPYRQQQSLTSPSLGAVYIYKDTIFGDPTSDKIVASYIGRPETDETYHRQLELLLEWYNNMQIMHENEVTSVKSYFEKRKKLNLLAFQPDKVISANVNNSKVARIYGCHMNEKLKDAGEKYIKQWLLMERGVDEFGNMITTIDVLDDPALIDELIRYNRKGNFDRVMALMQLMFQIEEDDGAYFKNEQKAEQMKGQMEKLKLNLFSNN